MKKIFTLAVSLALVSFAFAQHVPAGPSPYNKHKYVHDNRHPVKKFTARDRDEMIAKINMRYDTRIYDIKHSRVLRNADKRKMIRQLELNRKGEINAVYARFVGRNGKRIPGYANNDLHRH